jgi:protein TonB
VSGGVNSKTAQNFEYEGVVKLKVLVGADGSVKDVVVVESSGKPTVDAVAVVAAKKYSYDPKINQGKPVDSWVEVAVPFRKS